jgi:hypothetical protein
MIAITPLKITATVVVAALVGLIVVACGSKHPPLGGGAGGNGQLDSNACSSEGAIRDCHVTLGMMNGVLNCALGSQTCTGGYWTSCSTAGGVTGAHYGGSFSTPGFSPFAATGPANAMGGLRVLDDPILPQQDASLCAQDSCDPYCWGWDDEAAATAPPPPPPPMGGATGGLPSGWYSGYGATTNPCAVPGAPGDCNFDQCCPANGGTCTDWGTAIIDGATGVGNCDPSSNSLAPTCSTLPDFTTQVGCQDPTSGDTFIPVCNRGGVIANTGTLKLTLGHQNSDPPGQFPFPEVHGYCNILLSSVPIAPNACINVDINAPQAGITCYGIQVGVHNSIFVNGAGTNGSASGPTNINVPECTGANNWGAINHQTCAAAMAGGATVYTCTTVPAMFSGYQTSPCHPQNMGMGNPPTLGQCQFDSCCYKNGSGNCVPWDSKTSGDCNAGPNGCSGPDFTAGTACTDVNADVHVQVCNRGTSDVMSGTGNIGFAAGDSGGQAPKNYPFVSAGGCTWDWAVVGGLASDSCVDLNVTQQLLNGNAVDCSSMAGGPAAFLATSGGQHTIRINTTGVTGTVATGNNNVQISECAGDDNWSIYDSTVACSGCPAIPSGGGGGTFTYTATCPPGYQVKWQYLAYDVTISGSSPVEFDGHTTQVFPDGGPMGMPSTDYTLANPPMSPTATSCLYTGPAGSCPIDLAMIMGQDALSNQLTLEINPSGGSGANDWAVSYDCIPFE